MGRRVNSLLKEDLHSKADLYLTDLGVLSTNIKDYTKVITISHLQRLMLPLARIMTNVGLEFKDNPW